ncbi:isoprenyl transferase [Clostridium paridis]|uniref:Isoprenyl transferase n=1 Tax=Clostridium paridis TaxID=2803863 RepID=A0A937FG00_9CLOT|nr:isoprenyl transferase [Clostridium paridis]MBL4930871.1 isoprenyl transferase [Clostridium paridis]
MFNFFKKKENNSNKDLDIALDYDNIPKHIAIIMDGNGRWAKQKGLPRSFGHKAGTETVRKVIKECNRLGVKYLTLYAFSTENWKRPKDEVNVLMNILVEYLRKEFNELNENNVVINHIGDITGLPLECQKELISAYERTKNNTGVTMNLAINYGGRTEIVDATKKIIEEIENGILTINNLNEKMFSSYLYTKNMPDPDLIIRPSGEQRLSNFLLWQCAYSEFWYSNINWPDFNEDDLRKAIFDYQNRDRRYGGIK